MVDKSRKPGSPSLTETPALKPWEACPHPGDSGGGGTPISKKKINAGEALKYWCVTPSTALSHLWDLLSSLCVALLLGILQVIVVTNTWFYLWSWEGTLRISSAFHSIQRPWYYRARKGASDWHPSVSRGEMIWFPFSMAPEKDPSLPLDLGEVTEVPQRTLSVTEAQGQGFCSHWLFTLRVPRTWSALQVIFVKVVSSVITNHPPFS